jgi:hypothetical protein
VPGIGLRDRLIGDTLLATHDDKHNSGLCQAGNCETTLGTFQGPGVQYCGFEDDRTDWRVFPVGTHVLNRACFAHDKCYCDRCIRQECRFTGVGEAKSCDDGFFAVCNNPNMVVPPSRAWWVCKIARWWAGRRNGRPACIPDPMTNPQGATTCSGDCQSEVCVRGQCIPVKNAANQTILPANTPVSAKVTIDNQVCQDGVAAPMCSWLPSCNAYYTQRVVYKRCDGAALNLCQGHSQHGTPATCGQICVGVCPVTLSESWDEIDACSRTGGKPVVGGPLPLNAVVWFGSQPQLNKCLQCVSP